MAGALTPDEVADLKSKLEKEKAKLPAPGDFCQKWPDVKPVLNYVHDLPILPEKYKAAITAVISIGDTVYSTICNR